MFPEIVSIIVILLFAVIFHECAHGWVANKLGDPTAKAMGRLTLNPLKHIDPLGTIIVPIVLRWLGFMPLGWAKPVPVNFANLNNPKRDMIWVAMAGPAVNVVMALLFSLLLQWDGPAWFYRFCNVAVVINLILAVFNMIPIPPLDGSRLVMGLLPDQLMRPYVRLERYGILIILVLLNVGMLNFIWGIVLFLSFYLGVDYSALGG